jgi:hypothetical protein
MIPVLKFLSAPLQIGDTDCRNSQRFTPAFLQSLAMVSGPDAPASSWPFALGTVPLLRRSSP